MTTLKFTNSEITKMKNAISRGHKSWDDKQLADIKGKIKDYVQIKTNYTCAYCNRPTWGEFRLVLDIEHILPKSNKLFTKYMFTSKNLTLSCKRCNMMIKKNKIDFLNTPYNRYHMFKSQLYKFIHPNLDNYRAHLNLLILKYNNRLLFKYDIKNKSKKGLYTYKYFKLHHLEYSNFNKNQGIKICEEIKDRFIREEFDKINPFNK